MKREEAKIIDRILGSLSESQRAHLYNNIDNGNVKAYADGKEIRYDDAPYSITADRGEILSNPTFTDGYTFYKVERKINWSKAMENGAWGQKFLMRNDNEPCKVTTLAGYISVAPYRYRFIDNLGDDYEYCVPLKDFVVPDSWLED